MKFIVPAATLVTIAAIPALVHAQANGSPPSATTVPATCHPKSWRDPQPTYRSVEVLADRRVTFRVCAPLARTVKVVSPDLGDLIPAGSADGIPDGLAMTRDATGLWTGTIEKQVPAQTYRFNFQVDGAPVPDPRGTTFSEQLNGTTSTFEVSGPDGAFQTYRSQVPHGTIGVLEYPSGALGITRRAHIYTPPGYNRDARRYPVLYLVHGAGDSDDSWTSIGHAHYILDNLIASGAAAPMIVVMPAGHTPVTPGQNILANPDFGRDLIDDLIPFIDTSYRTIKEPGSRAMAGLSMGGAHTLNFGLTHPDLFSAVGIFSMGLGLNDPKTEIPAYEKANAVALQRTANTMKLVYYAVGKDDFLYASIAPTRAMLDRAGIRYQYVETTGGHSWSNWRKYLADFTPRLFKR